MAGGPFRVRVPVRVDFAGAWSDVPDFSEQEGGAVLNAAIDRYVEGEASWDGEGLRVSYRLDVGPDSHLGTSSASNLAWLQLIHALTGTAASPVEVVEKAYALDGLMGEKGGKQDGYAAALGGINLLRFGAADEPAQVEPILLAPERIAALEELLLLCDAGPSSGSGGQHEELWRRFREGDAHVRDTLRGIRDTVEPARDALVAGYWDALGELVTRNRELARALAAAR